VSCRLACVLASALVSRVLGGVGEDGLAAKDGAEEDVLGRLRRAGELADGSDGNGEVGGRPFKTSPMSPPCVVSHH